MDTVIMEEARLDELLQQSIEEMEDLFERLRTKHIPRSGMNLEESQTPLNSRRVTFVQSSEIHPGDHAKPSFGGLSPVPLYPVSPAPSVLPDVPAYSVNPPHPEPVVPSLLSNPTSSMVSEVPAYQVNPTPHIPETRPYPPVKPVPLGFSEAPSYQMNPIPPVLESLPCPVNPAPHVPVSLLYLSDSTPPVPKSLPYPVKPVPLEFSEALAYLLRPLRPGVLDQQIANNEANVGSPSGFPGGAALVGQLVKIQRDSRL